MLAFSNKTKIIEANMPEKVKNYLDTYFINEMSFFQKKYKFKIIINSDKSLLIPEYKILLLNKNNKIINKVEHFVEIKGKKNKMDKKNNYIEKKGKVDLKQKDTKNNIVLGKTLWVRRKKRISN